MTATALHAHAAPVRARRPLPADEALRWVVRDELPKRREGESLFSTGGSVHPMWTNGLFTRVDNWSREPGMPLAMGDPHPDALRIEAEITAIDREVKIALATGAALPFDLTPYRIDHGLNPDCQAEHWARRAAESVLPWILTFAKRGGRPDHGSPPICERYLGTRGQVTLWINVDKEVGHGPDGRPWYVSHAETTTPSRKDTYRAGTYCKVAWPRDAGAVAEDRATYAAWHAALCLLVERLNKTETCNDAKGRSVEAPILSSLILRPPSAPATPWIDLPAPPRVLVSEAPANDPGPSLNDEGEVALPRNIHVLRPRPRTVEPARRLDPAAYPLPAAA